MKSSGDYVRDKRSPIPKNELVSKVMRANKAKNTIPELKLRKALWVSGMKGYRINRKDLPGKPDISFSKYKIAIFIHGCFWHRCPKCNYALPKTNVNFWNEKFTKNIERDDLKVALLTRLSWKVVTVWECEINNNLYEVLSTLQKSVK